MCMTMMLSIRAVTALQLLMGDEDVLYSSVAYSYMLAYVSIWVCVCLSVFVYVMILLIAAT